jgi:hypothetical protein
MTELSPTLRALTVCGLERSSKLSIRAGRLLRHTIVLTLFPSSFTLLPTVKPSPGVDQAATRVIQSSGSNRIMRVKSTGSCCPTSSVIAAKSSSAVDPRATSVATRRSAACCLASRAI